jgi:beta-glucanase (GH16 family)
VLAGAGALVLAMFTALTVANAATTNSGSASPAAAPNTVPAPPSGWSTVFSDDFTGASGTGVNTSNWLYDTGTGYPGGAGNWGTGEVETATNSTNNVYQDGSGHLVIKPINSGGSWTSGRIETQRTDFAAPAGGQLEVSASIQQPNPASGLGYWPAFWMLGAAARPVGATNWPSIGEIDAMEDVNALSEATRPTASAPA